MVYNIIETFDLTKIYHLKGKNFLKALDNINISIKEGEIFGLLGPNGAGKTTAIQIFTTLKQPTSGYAIIDGYDIIKKPKKAKEKVALMLEASMLYLRITAYDNLKFFCKIYKVPNFEEKIKRISKEFELDKWLNQYVENFSSGMKMKLALCRTLLLDRKILFLDEPTLGLDVKSISFIIEKLKNINKTIFMTSHDMNVVEKLCDNIAFINKGKIIKTGTKEDIKKLLQKEIKVEIQINESRNQLKSELSQQKYINEVTTTKNGLIVTLIERKKYRDLLYILSKYPVLKIMEHQISLEDLFINFSN